MLRYSDIRNLHVNVNDIPQKYKNCSLHIALEKADTERDWNSFKKLYNLSPKFLYEHLENTSFVFDYNFKQLKNEEQIKLLSI